MAALYFILGGQGSRDYLVELKYGELLRILPGYTIGGKNVLYVFPLLPHFFPSFSFLENLHPTE